MRRILDYKILIIILVFGALLRVVGLSQMPPALNWDEISHGYNAYSILKTGKDEWGQLLPITNFRAYGDYPLPLNLYLTIPFIAIFGLSEVGLRLPHALLGTFTIAAVYFLTVGVTKNKKVGLIASFLAAIDPWLLFPSRAVFQSNLAVFFLIAGMAAFFNREKKKWLLPLSYLLLGLTLFSYHSTRIFVPLLLIVLIIFYRKIKYLVLVLLGAFFILLPTARARSNVVFIINEGAINQIENLRATSNSPLKRLMYNKVTYFGITFARNYVSYLSPNFLFLKGGTQYQFSVPNHGVLYLVSLPFFYIGIFFLVRGLKNKDYRFLLFWLILAPIPAAITTETNAVIRATTMLPIPEILISLGLFEVIKRFSKYQGVIISLFTLLMLFSLEGYLNTYATNYRTNYSWAWQYGYKEVVNYVKTNYPKYDQIIVTKKYGEPHEFFLFYLQYDPVKYQNDPNLIRFNQSNWYWVDHFDKFWFVNDWQVLDSPSSNRKQNTFITESKHIVDCNNQKCLLITSPNNAPKDPPSGEASWKKINGINFLDGTPSFEMYGR